jgi:hypothetical protein
VPVILPDEVFTQLRYLLDQGDMIQWRTGDFILDVWAEIAKYSPPGDHKKDHAIMITQMASRTGADKSTLRSRERVSEFFDEDMRNKWQPPYSYSQMKALRTAGDEWETVAEWGLDGGWNNGVATTDEIRDKISGQRDPKELLLKRLVSMEKTARRIIDDEATPVDVREGMVLALAVIQDTKELV